MRSMILLVLSLVSLGSLEDASFAQGMNVGSIGKVRVLVPAAIGDTDRPHVVARLKQLQKQGIIVDETPVGNYPVNPYFNGKPAVAARMRIMGVRAPVQDARPGKFDRNASEKPAVRARLRMHAMNEQDAARQVAQILDMSPAEFIGQISEENGVVVYNVSFANLQ